MVNCVSGDPCKLINMIKFALFIEANSTLSNDKQQCIVYRKT